MAQVITPTTTTLADPGFLRAAVREARPKQWLKNMLVFAPAGMAGLLNTSDHLGKATVAFICFCLTSSGTYYVNDLLDVEADRRHPTKRNRPIASGAISIPTAVAIAVVLMTAGPIITLAAGQPRVAWVLLGYAALSLSYSKSLKHIAVVDLMAVSAGFVLRAIAGAVAVDITISQWFFIVTSFGAMFMVVGKRKAEHAELGDEAQSIRPTLGEYSASYLNTVFVLTLSGALITYGLWAVERSKELQQLGFPWYSLSMAPFAAGLLRYAHLVDRGQGGAPEDVVIGDRTLQVIGLVWLVVLGAGVYVS